MTTQIDSRKAIGDRIIRECIALYHRALRAQAEAPEVIGDDPELDNLAEVLVDRMLDAEQNLMRAILAPVRPRGCSRPERHLWPSRGVRCDGQLYLVSPRPDGDRPAVGQEHFTDVMHLTVIDLADVADAGTLGDDPAYHPDGSRIYHADDPAAADGDDD